MLKYISVAKVNQDNLIAPDPPKEHTARPPRTEKYTRTYLKYNYGTKEAPMLSEPLFELKKTTASFKKNNKGVWKLNLRLQDAADIEGCSKLDLGIRKVIMKYKTKYGLHSFTVENPGDLRSLYFYQRDEHGNPIEGLAPQMSFKLEHQKSSFYILNFEFDSSGNPVLDKQTGTVKYTERPINYQLLENKTFECVVVFCLRDLYHSTGMPIPSLFVRTCWVMSTPVERGSVDLKSSVGVKDAIKNISPEELKLFNEGCSKLLEGASVQAQTDPSGIDPLKESEPPASKHPTIKTGSSQIPQLSGQESDYHQPQIQARGPEVYHQMVNIPTKPSMAAAPTISPGMIDLSAHIPKPGIDFSHYMQSGMISPPQMSIGKL